MAEKNIKIASELKVDKLYHYTSFEKPERLAQILTEGTIYFSNPKDFNDPWDCRPWFNKSQLDDPEVRERTVQWFVQVARENDSHFSEKEHRQGERELRNDRQLLEQMIDKVSKKTHDDIIKQRRVYCLSALPDSTLMWSHYGQAHKGVCLEFSAENNLFSVAVRVEYRHSYPEINLFDERDRARLLLLIAKSSVWEYEKEFRLFAKEQSASVPDIPTTINGFWSLPKGALKAVIVGCEMSDKERDKVRSLIKDSGANVTFKVAKLVPDRYDLDIREG